MRGIRGIGFWVLSVMMAALTIPALAATDSVLQNDVQHALKAKEFANVTVAANEKGVVTLNGAVDKYQYKLNAEKKAKKTAGVREVDNEIQVSTAVPDTELQSKLNSALSYDRAGYGHVFDNVYATVNNGVVTLEGAVRWDPDKASALALVANRAGVKDVVDHVRVLRTSIYDDELRVRVLRALYGDPALSKYGMDPRSPIRIIVDGGHVSLYGTVDSHFDKNVAGMRARSVSGAFSVENHLNTVRG